LNNRPSTPNNNDITADRQVNGINGIHQTNGVNGVYHANSIDGINLTNGINGVYQSNGINGVLPNSVLDGAHREEPRIPGLALWHNLHSSMLNPSGSFHITIKYSSWDLAPAGSTLYLPELPQQRAITREVLSTG
jgi:hypothetical protein